MKQRILVAVVGVPALLLVLCVAPDWATGILLSLLVIVGAHELLAAVCSPDKAKRWFWLSAAMGVVTVWLTYIDHSQFAGSNMATGGLFLLAALVAAVFLLAAVEYGGRQTMTFQDICAVLVAGLVIPAALSCLMAADWSSFRWWPLFAAIPWHFLPVWPAADISWRRGSVRRKQWKAPSAVCWALSWAW